VYHIILAKENASGPCAYSKGDTCDPPLRVFACHQRAPWRVSASPLELCVYGRLDLVPAKLCNQFAAAHDPAVDHVSAQPIIRPTLAIHREKRAVRERQAIMHAPLERSAINASDVFC
jgi:hypothetical protein